MSESIKTKRKKIKTLNINLLRTGDCPFLKNTQTVFQHAVNSVSSFYTIYQKLRRGRGAGSTTHEEQDLLRAMLVFACSGLDAVVKQLIKDSLSEIINRDADGKGARQEFQKFVERRMKRMNNSEAEEKIPFVDTNFIAQVLTSNEPKTALLRSLRDYLLSDSLQSRDQLLKVAAHFAITKDQVLANFDMTKTVFEVRNDIIHEMDVDLSGKAKGQKKRRGRGESDMVEYCENIFNIGVCFINVVAEKIYDNPS